MIIDKSKLFLLGICVDVQCCKNDTDSESKKGYKFSILAYHICKPQIYYRLYIITASIVFVFVLFK